MSADKIPDSQAPVKAPEKDPAPRLDSDATVSYRLRSGEMVSASLKTIQSIGEVVDQGLWPDLDQIEVKDLLASGDPFVILDAAELATDLGPFYVCRIADPATGKEATTAIGYSVVFEKITTVKNGNNFPVWGHLEEMQPKGQGRPYVDFI